MNILGINAFSHDPSVCLIQDGKIVAAVEEDKISRQKYFMGFPTLALQECLDLGGIQGKDVDIVTIPRVLSKEMYTKVFHLLRYFPHSLHLLGGETTAIDSSIRFALYFKLKSILREVLHPQVQIIEVPHHLTHAASVFYWSEYTDALVVIADGLAEYDTNWVGMADASGVRSKQTTAFPHSLGLAYAAFTDLLGFRPFKDEWKVMGMAAYGKPRWYEECNDLFTLSYDNHILVNQHQFSFATHGKKQWFHSAFPLLHLKRLPHQPITQDHYDLAHSFQLVFEDTLMTWFKRLKHAYPSPKKVCLSGGVFLNCLVNGRLYDSGIFEDVYVDPNPSDAGSALGAAVSVYQQTTGHLPKRCHHANRLGRTFKDPAIKKVLDHHSIRYKTLTKSEMEMALKKNSIIGLFQGKAEFGPRALGSRSIIANPHKLAIKDEINARVKHREPFRPFAPSTPYSQQRQAFQSSVFSPYMSFVSKVSPAIIPHIPAVVHADHTARLQSILAKQDPLLTEMTQTMKQLTGFPVVLNTSFNIRGEPIIYSPQDALDTFARANLDVLMIGKYLVTKD